MDVFLFIATVLSMVATAAIVHIVCKHVKLKAIITEAIFGNGKEQHNCTMQRYTISALTFINHTEMHNIQKKTIPTQL